MVAAALTAGMRVRSRRLHDKGENKQTAIISERTPTSQSFQAVGRRQLTILEVKYSH